MYYFGSFLNCSHLYLHFVVGEVVMIELYRHQVTSKTADDARQMLDPVVQISDEAFGGVELIFTGFGSIQCLNHLNVSLSLEGLRQSIIIKEFGKVLSNYFILGKPPFHENFTNILNLCLLILPEPLKLSIKQIIFYFKTRLSRI